MDADRLDAELIVDETPAVAWERLRVVVLAETGSTNEEALVRARAGEPAGTVVVAETQTRGRGRKGRHWISPPGSGLYFSLILRPERPLPSWPLLTHVSVVALAGTLEEMAREGQIPHPLDMELKWPNDLLLGGRKAAGILLETAGNGGSNRAAIVGVGINVAPVAWPEELRGQVTSITEAAGVTVPRRRLLVRFLYHFQLGYEQFARGEDKAILAEWKKRSRMWKETPVWIMDEGRRRAAVTRGLSESGALIVQVDGGAEEVILAADVSIRRLDRGER
jgi:BirA family transcriptional regulator, biotin operon repressor / biotin---[acetyl-CoA-carboxylase] ligase